MFDFIPWEYQVMRPPDRLIRFVDDESIVPLLCQYDAENKVLRITRQYYDTLDEKEKEIVWRATRDMTYDILRNEMAVRRRGFR